jgi:hypothetical protein
MAWNLTADGVWHLLVADFRNHLCAGDRLLNSLCNPLAACDRSWGTLNAYSCCAAWVAWINHTLLDDWSWDTLCFRNPFATADINGVTFCHWLADRVAHVFVASFSFCLVGRAADFFVAGLIHWLADIVADRAIACLIHWLADGVANIFVACLIHWLANATGHVSVAGRVDRLADIVSAGLVACLVDRLANRVALITVACFINVLCAGHRNGFCALIVHCLHAGILLRLPDGFLYRLTLRSTSAPSCHKIPAWRKRGCWSTSEATPSE